MYSFEFKPAPDLHLTVDGTPGKLGRINHYRNYAEALDQQMDRINCTYVFVLDMHTCRPHAVVVATKPIPAGNELFSDYGSDYFPERLRRASKDAAALLSQGAQAFRLANHRLSHLQAMYRSIHSYHNRGARCQVLLGRCLCACVHRLWRRKAGAMRRLAVAREAAEHAIALTRHL